MLLPYIYIYIYIYGNNNPCNISLCHKLMYKDNISVCYTGIKNMRGLHQRHQHQNMWSPLRTCWSAQLVALVVRVAHSLQRVELGPFPQVQLRSTLPRHHQWQAHHTKQTLIYLFGKFSKLYMFITVNVFLIIFFHDN